MTRLLLLASLCLWVSMPLRAQFVFTDEHFPLEISILDKAQLLNVGQQELSLEQAQKQTGFKQLKGKLGNLGFTSDTYWMRFEVSNALKIPVNYYLETAEPVTDQVKLYWLDDFGMMERQLSGDRIQFKDRSVPDHKTLFSLALEPGQHKTAYVEIRNDGEKNNLPLKLIRPSTLLEDTYHDQLIMGLFYGILLVIAVTYLFFYFAIKELSFLHYALYVLFMGLCQFSLDGFYHQYIGTGTSWVDAHMVIISAILSCFFFGKYTVTVLDIKMHNKPLYKAYQTLFILLGALVAAVVCIPAALPLAYPVINLLTIAGIILIFTTVVRMLIKRQPMDRYFVCGIVILFLCIVSAVLMNFGVFPENFATDNITKPGIALEVIALSLSMANRIRLLKSKKEELQEVALQKSEEMNDIKSYFLSNMSHELRTPLNAILGLASAMESESNDPTVRAHCEVIRYASHGLISSVNDILDFGRIEKGELKLTKQAFRPADVFDKLCGSMRKSIEDKGLDFEFSTTIGHDLSLNGDPVRLEQMLYNLLGNALKFTAQGSVSFKVSHVVHNGKAHLYVTISDTGVGIAKEKLQTVFGLFSQSNLDNKRKFGGFGIGLSIVKSLVDLHAGDIKLESVENEGTECHIQLDYEVVAHAAPVAIPNKKAFEIPLATIQTPAAVFADVVPDTVQVADPEIAATVAATPPITAEVRAAVATEELPPTAKHILIVEDNAMNQMVMKMMLKNVPNTTFEIANHGGECLEMMRKTPFDLILLDLQMPVMDGYEALETIRKGETGLNNMNIPVIVVTADVTADTRDRVFTLGANDYLTKPVDKMSLYEKIDAVFNKTMVKAS